MSRARLNKIGNPFENKDCEISADVMETISCLTKTGIKILNYMMAYSPKDEAKIYVDKDEVMLQCEIGEKSFFNGIKDLLKNKIIATSDKSFEYYFNHAFFGQNKN